VSASEVQPCHSIFQRSRVWERAEYMMRIK
jgi:hypothetical protein